MRAVHAAAKLFHKADSAAELEAVLILAGAIIPQQRRPPDEDKDDNDSGSDFDDLEDDDPSSRMRCASTRTNAKPQKNVRAKKGDDSDSDFESGNLVLKEE